MVAAMEIIILLIVLYVVVKYVCPKYIEWTAKRAAQKAANVAPVALVPSPMKVPEVEPISEPKTFPLDMLTFDIDKVKVYVHPEHGGAANILEFAETSVISFAEIRQHSYTVKHSKDGGWLSKLYKKGRFIDGNEATISFNRNDGIWYLYVFEYSVVGEYRRPKGWADLPWVSHGDPVGLLSCTNGRNGAWSVKGQAQERTNIAWTTAK